MDDLHRSHGGLCRFVRGYHLCLRRVPAGHESDLSLDTSSFSGPYTLFYLVGGLLGPVAGMSVAKFGARKNIVFFNVIAALGLFGLSQVRSLWQVYLFFGLMAGLGIAFGEFIPITTAINHWFVRRRSMAMGLLFASGGLGGFILPPLISRLISGLGWRWAWGFLAGNHLLLTVILEGILIRSGPEDVGQQPEKAPEVVGPPDLSQPSSSKGFIRRRRIGRSRRPCALRPYGCSWFYFRSSCL